MGGLRHVARDTREKVEVVIRKIGVEIEGLQEKLKLKRGDGEVSARNKAGNTPGTPSSPLT